VNEANQQTREKYQRISTVLSLYQQLRDIELDLPIDVISDVPADWQPSAQATLEMADKEYWAARAHERMRCQVVLKDGTGTITYWKNGKVFATKPAHVYVQSDMPGGYYDSLETRLQTRITIGLPYGGTETMYAKEIFGDKVWTISHSCPVWTKADLEAMNKNSRTYTDKMRAFFGEPDLWFGGWGVMEFTHGQHDAPLVTVFALNLGTISPIRRSTNCSERRRYKSTIHHRTGTTTHRGKRLIKIICSESCLKKVVPQV
jgi:hypothetical protein